ncbi:nose resistant to fluoxetine protein 6-like [Schistocerca serialis cubense]|uniref:nose resistant to fluoxetine protein 6-like n=1 Tax=Schistocerca serialis cubense TaxID=2023355 RepID=UPI00214E3770|nr:nose resistant to fluoxetine protein 6-like [Schistocerca serialis cubense]
MRQAAAMAAAVAVAILAFTLTATAGVSAAPTTDLQLDQAAATSTTEDYITVSLLAEDVPVDEEEPTDRAVRPVPQQQPDAQTVNVSEPGRYATRTLPDLPLAVAAAAAQLHAGSACGRDYSRYLDALRNFTLWAVQMYDASVKAPTGVLFGAVYQLGHYDECVSVRAAQYCLPEVRFKPSEPQPLPADPYTLNFDPEGSAWLKLQDTGDERKIRRDRISWALCVPSTCSATEVQVAMGAVLREVGPPLGASLEVVLDRDSCTSQLEQPTLRPAHITFMCFMGALILLVLYCSYYHMRSNMNQNSLQSTKNLGTKEQLIFAFSIFQNIQRLTEKNGKVRGLDSFHFVRFLFIIAVIAGHRMLISYGHPVYNGEDLDKIYSNFFSILLANGALVVDVFFTLAAFTSAYILFDELEKPTNAKNIFSVILTRYLRLTPSYLVILLFEICILPYIGNGPFWKTSVIKEQNRCSAYWWANILYINNYLDIKNLCMFPSWYLAVDFQMFVLTTFLIYIIWRWPKVGWIITGVIATLSVLIPFLVIYMWNIEPIVKPFPRNFKDPREDKTFQIAYVTTHTRAAPYIIGMISGILTHKGISAAFKVPMVFAYTGVAISAVIGLVTVLSGYIFFIPTRPLNPLEAAVYGSLCRVAIGLVVCSFIVLQTFGHMGHFVEKIQKTISSNIFIIFSRLTYGAYLIHTLPQLYDEGSLRLPRNVDWFTTIWSLLGDCCAVYFLAFLLFIGVEAPIRTISKILLS